MLSSHLFLQKREIHQQQQHQQQQHQQQQHQQQLKFIFFPQGQASQRRGSPRCKVVSQCILGNHLIKAEKIVLSKNLVITLETLLVARTCSNLFPLLK